MFGIRQKLLLGFGGLLLISLIIGVQSIREFDHLGQSVEVILKENYISVIACHDMQEAIRQTDKGILLILLGYDEEGRRLAENGLSRFVSASNTESDNITLPGEGDKAMRIRGLFEQYRRAVEEMCDSSISPDEKRASYSGTLTPLSEKIRNISGEILRMNQDNINETNAAAKREAITARRRMIFFLIACALIAGAFVWFANYWILKPIRHLTESANEIRSGNLDLAIHSRSRDEIGQLSEAFDAMTQRLREVRRNDRITISRSRHAITEIFKNLPSVIAVLDSDGRVEVATESAESFFGLKSGVLVQDISNEWIRTLVRQSQTEDRVAESEGFRQHFVNHREYFFQPMAVPIRDIEGHRTGTVVILRDVSQLRQQTEIKKGAISTVSHQLKTPLTSIRMAIHLLLEEKIGILSQTQTELLIAAREDSERLANILDDLLDISRMESGNALMELRNVLPHIVIRESAEPFLTEAKDKGIGMNLEIPDDVPEVRADMRRISHVFANLISNALKFTDPGGTITIAAIAESESVRFSVSDTGKGIPHEYLHRVFEQFFQTPDQKEKQGAGLGLAIVREIVRAHGGQTGVESRQGQGSVFWFTLPRADLL